MRLLPVARPGGEPPVARGASVPDDELQLGHHRLGLRLHGLVGRSRARTTTTTTTTSIVRLPAHGQVPVGPVDASGYKP